MISVKKALESVSPAVRKAFEATDQILTEKGAPHVLIGGLAVNALGYHYTTKDVDFLVRSDDVFDGTVVVTHKPGIPHSVGGVAIDYLAPRADYPTPVLVMMADALKESEVSKNVIVANDQLLVWMKLNVGRTKDLAAVEGLLRGGHIDAHAVLDFLVEVSDSARTSEEDENADRVLRLYEQCIDRAEADDGK